MIIRSKFDEDWTKTVASRVFTRFFYDLAYWPSFWPQMTHIRTWLRFSSRTNILTNFHEYWMHNVACIMFHKVNVDRRWTDDRRLMTDDRRRTKADQKSSPWAFGSGELKSTIKGDYKLQKLWALGPFFSSTIHPSIVHVLYQVFSISGFHSSQEKCYKNFVLLTTKYINEKHNSVIYGPLTPILVSPIHPPIVHVCTKFQLTDFHNSPEKC